jgi:hypothetical protein
MSHYLLNVVFHSKRFYDVSEQKKKKKTGSKSERELEEKWMLHFKVQTTENI